MDTETASIEILAVRKRLKDIEHRRAELAADDFAAKTDLMDQEHELQARLGQLQAEFAADTEGEVKREDVTDLANIVPPVV